MPNGPPPDAEGLQGTDPGGAERRGRDVRKKWASGPFFVCEGRGQSWPEVTDAARPAARAARAGRCRPGLRAVGTGIPASFRRRAAADLHRCRRRLAERHRYRRLRAREPRSQRRAGRCRSDPGPIHARSVLAGSGSRAAHARALRALCRRAGEAGDDAADRGPQAVCRAVARRGPERDHARTGKRQVSLPIDDIHRARLAPDM